MGIYNHYVTFYEIHKSGICLYRDVHNVGRWAFTQGGMSMRFPTLIDVPRDWCATCKHEDGDFCEFGDDCMYQQNADGTYNHDLPPTEYEEE